MHNLYVKALLVAAIVMPWRCRGRCKGKTTGLAEALSALTGQMPSKSATKMPNMAPAARQTAKDDKDDSCLEPVGWQNAERIVKDKNSTREINSCYKRQPQTLKNPSQESLHHVFACFRMWNTYQQAGNLIFPRRPPLLRPNLLGNEQNLRERPWNSMAMGRKPWEKHRRFWYPFETWDLTQNGKMMSAWFHYESELFQPENYPNLPVLASNMLWCFDCWNLIYILESENCPLMNFAASFGYRASKYGVARIQLTTDDHWRCLFSSGP